MNPIRPMRPFGISKAVASNAVLTTWPGYSTPRSTVNTLVSTCNRDHGFVSGRPTGLAGGRGAGRGSA